MLCFRCEFRARYLILEDERKGSGHAPRYECKTDWSKHTCYMYRPVKPVVIEPSDYEKRLRKETGVERPIGGILGGRMCVSKEQPEFEVVSTHLGDDKYLVENKVKK